MKSRSSAPYWPYGRCALAAGSAGTSNLLTGSGCAGSKGGISKRYFAIGSLASQEEGSALADVLFGDYNPAGRLVATWVKSLDDLPPMMDYDIRKGRTYMYFKGQPLYPFGFGLSYTIFEYSNLRLSADSVTAAGEVVASMDIKNTGTRAGDEVVQLYVKHLNSAVERPINELRGFKRITLQPNETRTVRLTVKEADLTYWDAGKHSFVVEPGKVSIMLGASSADVRLEKTIEMEDK